MSAQIKSPTRAVEPAEAVGRAVPVKPPRAIMRPVGKAIHDFDMIHDGDRILIGISGGKDSLSLLHVLNHLSRYAPVNFAVGAITVDPMVPDFDPSGLRDYLAALDIPYFYCQQPIMEQAQEHLDEDGSYCAFCSRMKRGIMYTTAREHGYNVIALAQHLDDLAESFLMAAFHNGMLRTMKAHYTNRDGDLRIIRPLAYVREAQTRDFAAAAGLPVVPDSCPACFQMPTQRQHFKELLAAEERANPLLFPSLLNAIRPLMGVKTAD